MIIRARCIPREQSLSPPCYDAKLKRKLDRYEFPPRKRERVELRSKDHYMLPTSSYDEHSITVTREKKKRDDKLKTLFFELGWWKPTK
jgi:hypothetical protein